LTQSLKLIHRVRYEGKTGRGKLWAASLTLTGITAYLKNGGSLENAAAMANHASTRTTQLYDRRRDEVNLDEVERFRGLNACCLYYPAFAICAACL
jgi:hypothetical protein